jgi:2'-5' RNA ligase
MRTFIAVELPDEVRKNIVELINELKTVEAAVKWVEENNLHITMKFLGEVDNKKLDDLIELTTKAVSGKGSFKAKFQEVGAFPRVVWVGTAEGGDKLCALAKELENVLSGSGFRSEEKEFRPHITIGRIKDKKGVDKLKEKMEGFKDAKFGEAWVDSISIMKSTLSPKGPIYEKIKGVKL